MATLAMLGSADTLQSIWIWINGIDVHIALLMVFALLFLAGCGLPLPEDIPLTFTGILLGLPSTHHAYGNFHMAAFVIVLVCYSSIIAGDIVAYKLGFKYGHAVATVPPFKWMITKRRMKKLDRWFAKFGNWTVFFGRMLAGIRFVTFVMAGTARMPIAKFVAFDSLAALVTVPAWIALGYVVGTHFHQLARWASMISSTTWIVLGAVLVVLVVIHFVRARRSE